MGSFEAEEVGESTGRVFFDDGQRGRYFVCVDIGIESSEDQFGGESGSIGRCVEFTHEATVPGVY